MFYCDTCGTKNGWPTSRLKSFGTCEICEKPLVGCNDVPSNALPIPPKPTPTFESISKEAGTRFKFVCDIERGHVAEYMVMPKLWNGNYWTCEIINIHPDNPLVGTITSFKSDDTFMEDKIVISS